MRVAVLDDYQGVALGSADWAAVTARAEVVVFSDHVADEGELAERLQDFEVVVLMRERTPFPRSLFERLPKLRLLVTTGARNASVDAAAASDAGVVFCGTAGLPYPTAELTWGLILALVRRIAAEDAAVRRGEWQTTLGEGLQGKTLGVIGLGRLGSQVASVGRAFGMSVVAWSENLTRERTDEVGVELARSKAELLERADVVTIHLVLSERTRGLVGAAELGLMRESAYLVNTSRGPIVDEGGLVEALRSGSIAGAGLDVFDTEPLPAGHPLLSLDNVVLTPHVGYVTKETYEVFYGEAVEGIVAFLDGAPVRVIGGGA
ncbi:MAG: D-2-hydroxyacid dehydrogenase family protein [Dehalococcoidia bacterium]|jgi:phosphoglycerate dehydrogenase-like enzyme|nr:D-2-hydroxyacid dehydrogenase family protein [Dehalococcoidia bacterium]